MLAKIGRFFPRIQEKLKKKGLHHKWKTFFPNSSEDQRSDSDQSQIIGGDAAAGHTQNIGGDTLKLLGGIYPPSPRVSALLDVSYCCKRKMVKRN